MKNKLFLIASVLSILFYIGCDKESTSEVSESKVITADETIINSEIDQSVDDVAIIAEDQLETQIFQSGKSIEPQRRFLPACATVTSVLVNDTINRTIDFGTQGCAMPNGNVLKGKMIIKFSKNTESKVRTINYSLQGFYHNDNLIEGSKSIKYELKTSDLLATNHPVTSHTVDLRITNADGKIATRTGLRVREFVEGFTTYNNREDDVFKAWGSNETTFLDGSKFSSKITTPLLSKMSCKMPHPVSGIVETIKGESKSILDYGNGDCDKLATLTIDGVSKEIVLEKKRTKS